MTYHRCKRCGYRTSSVIAIQGHMRTHTAKRMFTVTILTKVNGQATGASTVTVEDGSTITIDQPIALQVIPSGKPSLT